VDVSLVTTDGKRVELIDITKAPRSFLDALAEEQPCFACTCKRTKECAATGFHYVFIPT
jgi:hypothetical protein